MSAVIATYIPVSQGVMDDASLYAYGPWLQRGLMRRFTTDLFGEDWYDVDTETQRLELGQVMEWDWFPAEDEDD